MFGNLLGGFLNKEKLTHDTIKAALEDIAEELGCDYRSFFVMIKPTDEEFNMKFYVYKMGNTPTFIREISLKEILGQNVTEG